MSAIELDGAVTLKNLFKSYGDRVVVDDVSLEIKAGEFFSMLGPSGCGKTTTLRMIGGFEQPDSGSIYIDSRDVTNDEPEERPLNTVFQNYSLFPHLTSKKMSSLVCGSKINLQRVRSQKNNELVKRLNLFNLETSANVECTNSQVASNSVLPWLGR